tara:strand:+ start:355 stop:1491 length:1137 start_codon:yes stop_codon:yes gene_type:complete
LTYQTFPAETANTIQTISLIKNCVRMGLDIKLIFPSRSINSSDSIEELQKHYDFQEDFYVEAKEHRLPFKGENPGKFLEKIRFNISHFLWSKKTVNSVLVSERNGEKYITRSDWIFYFLSKANKKVLFECHQVSKIRKFVINSVQNKKNSYIIFTNEILKKEFKIKKNFEKNLMILHNGYDSDYFEKAVKFKKTKKVVFVGKLIRFEKDRNIEFLVNSFSDKRLSDYKFTIVGGPNRYKDLIEKKIVDKDISNVEFLGNLSRRKTIAEIQESEVGVLINTDENKHSFLHTSPIKYFEYLKAKLKIVAVDFPAHRSLPMSEKIIFFENNNKESFVNAILKTLDLPEYDIIDEDVRSISERTRVLVDFLARPEGLEPPTL